MHLPLRVPTGAARHHAPTPTGRLSHGLSPLLPGGAIALREGPRDGEFLAQEGTIVGFADRCVRLRFVLVLDEAIAWTRGKMLEKVVNNDKCWFVGGDVLRGGEIVVV